MSSLNLISSDIYNCHFVCDPFVRSRPGSYAFAVTHSFWEDIIFLGEEIQSGEGVSKGWEGKKMEVFEGVSYI